MVRSNVYQVTCSVVVPVGINLTIEQNATIVFNPGTDINVAGTLNVDGTSGSPVTFTSATGRRGSWQGLYVASSGSLNLTYANVSDAGQGWSADNVGWNADVEIDCGSAVITHADLTSAGTGLETNGGNVSVSASQMDGNAGSGIAVTTGSALALSVSQSDASDNSGDGITIGSPSTGSTIFLQENTVNGNHGRGLSLSGMTSASPSAVDIEGNSFDNNGSDGLGIWNGNSSDGNEMTILGNTLDENAGDGAHVWSMTGNSLVNFGDNQMENNGANGFETDLTLDLPNSTISGNTVSGNAASDQFNLDASTSGGNDGFPSLAGTGFSVYRVLGTISAGSNYQFTVAPGVEVGFDAGVGFSANANAQMTMNATSDQPITFTSSTGSGNSWSGLYTGPGATLSASYVTIANAGRTWGDNGVNWNADLDVNGAGVALANVTLTGSSYGLQTSGGSVTLTGGDITGNTGAGIVAQSGTALTLAVSQSNVSGNSGDGISIGSPSMGSTVLITDTVAGNNRGRGLSLGGMTNTSAGAVDIENDTFTNNGSDGLGLWSDNGTGGNVSIIAGNTLDNNAGDGAHIWSMTGNSLVNFSNNQIEDNRGNGFETDITLDLPDSAPSPTTRSAAMSAPTSSPLARARRAATTASRTWPARASRCTGCAAASRPARTSSSPSRRASRLISTPVSPSRSIPTPR